MLKLARELFTLSKDVRYADYYENARGKAAPRMRMNEGSALIVSQLFCRHLSGGAHSAPPLRSSKG